MQALRLSRWLVKRGHHSISRPSTSSQCTKIFIIFPVSRLNCFSVVFSTFLSALIASTVYDVTIRRRSGNVNKLYAAFSVFTNGRQLFEMKKNSSASAIDCLNGIRALSIFWIIFGHRVFLHTVSFLTSYAHITK